MKYASILILIFFGCQPASNESERQQAKPQLTAAQQASLDTATLAGGCFWCVEASFEQIIGVEEAVSGYAGGSKESAEYGAVSSGRTKHAETVQVFFDPKVISYETILDIFFVAHDPTQLNRQGPDVGPQYRSEIFYHNPEQKRIAEAKIKELNPKFGDEIVTKISQYTEFFDAEEYHQDYEEKHPFQPYIVSVSRPKIEKVKSTFIEIVKPEYK